MGKKKKKHTKNKKDKKNWQFKQGHYYALIDGIPTEEGAIEQMENAMSLPISIAGALMPDAHQGYGLPIGGVLATENTIIPYAVGMDIGCRMALSIFFVENPENFIIKYREKLKNILVENTRFGKKTFEGQAYDTILERPEFHQIPLLKKLKKIATEQLGTSGQGNHFVEFGIVEIIKDNEIENVPKGKYLGLLSHSGSRHFGYEIAKYYSAIAEQKINLPNKLKKLAWLELDTSEGEEYWHAMNLAGDYAKANHNYIHKRIAKALGIKPLAKIENHHNFAWKEHWNGKDIIIHRKGATPANKGDLGIIPGSMTTPAYIIKGKGCKKTLNSASHGAGRLLSRRKALKTFTWKQLKQVLKQADVELIGGGLDEAPMAYKDINTVINKQQNIIDILGKFYPRIVRMN